MFRPWFARYFFALLLVLAPAMPAVLADSGFIEDLGDVPLMPGLTLAAEESVRFDSPSGRIVETVAYDRDGRLAPEAVAEFYARSLPQLGWQAVGENAFRREGELLRLEIAQTGGTLRVRFFLKPG